jgi:3-dehydroquinate synthase
MKPDKVAILVDENTRRDCLPVINPELEWSIVEISSGEANKTIQTCIALWSELTKLGLTRKSVLINLGGGVIVDMGGFVASTYKRGIRFINIPTTLLSQVDASIGGKLGIDFEGYKNHIGIFRDPDSIIISDILLKTLPSREIISGFAEVLKHGLIEDIEYWNKVKMIEPVSNSSWEAIIARSVAIKNEVVQADPTEKGKRKILNFGHTVGHAIESWNLMQGNNITHGEAIAAGMIVEANMSKLQNRISPEENMDIQKTITRIFPKVEKPSFGELLSFMRQDKKNSEDQISFSILNKVGECDFDIKVTDEVVEASYNSYSQLYK